MSFYLFYFETKNADSVSYQNFAEVGKFSVPAEFDSGELMVLLNGKRLRSSIISDDTGQSANNLFSKNHIDQRMLLFNFIENRINNESVVSHIGGFIETGLDELIVNNVESISFMKLKDNFSMNIFRKNSCFQLTSRSK
jgi:hypothetical protein